MIRAPEAPSGCPRAVDGQHDQSLNNKTREESREEMGKKLTNGTTEDVCLVIGKLELLLHAQELRRKGLVDLPQVNLVLVDATTLQRQLDGFDGANTHDAGLAGRNTIRDDASQGLETELLDSSLGRDDVGGGAVTDARGIAGRDGAALLEDGGQLGETLNGSLSSWVLIDREGLGGL